MCPFNLCAEDEYYHTQLHRATSPHVLQVALREVAEILQKCCGNFAEDHVYCASEGRKNCAYFADSRRYVRNIFRQKLVEQIALPDVRSSPRAHTHAQTQTHRHTDTHTHTFAWYFIEFFRGCPRGGDNFASLFQVLQTLYSKRQKHHSYLNRTAWVLPVRMVLNLSGRADELCFKQC